MKPPKTKHKTDQCLKAKQVLSSIAENCTDHRAGGPTPHEFRAMVLRLLDYYEDETK